MNTKEAIEIIGTKLSRKTAIISSFGRTSEEVNKLYPKQTLFLDSMGDITSVACGIALAVSPLPVVAFDTDGSHLMGLSFLPVLAERRMELTNFLIVVFDNKIYECAGGIKSRYVDLDWKLLGRAWGLNINVVNNRDDLYPLIKNAFKQFLYIVIEIENKDPIPISNKHIDGIGSKYQFINHLEKYLGINLFKPAIKS